MDFTIDKQTLDDLNIFGKQGGISIYNFFCSTYTKGGALLLEKMFRYPLADKDEINNRTDTIRFFQKNKITFPFNGQLFDIVDKYLQNTEVRSKLSNEEDTLKRKFRSAIGVENEYELLHKGVIAMIEIINSAKDFIHQIKKTASFKSYEEDVEKFEFIFKINNLDWTQKEKNKKHLRYPETAKYDRILRFEKNREMRILLELIFRLDVFISVGNISTTYGLTYAKATNNVDKKIEIKDLYHLNIKDPVKNDVSIGKNSNMIFLTGANMAGKSTLMKSIGIAVFLAHVGFPVPATAMEFCVQDGLFTTINLPDNMNVGYSHFYAEVLRVKKIAYEVAKEKKFLIIFDELFRGTNVKDAYDATVAILEAFAKREQSTFIISTHIIEAGETLMKKNDNIKFLYLPTKMEGEIPAYTYTLEEGITNDRHGMVIIRNEKILEILNEEKQLTYEFFNR